MSLLEALGELACPRCTGSLERELVAGMKCSVCGTAYPLVGNVPCLLPEPAFWRARAVQLLDEYLVFTAGRLEQMELEVTQHGTDLLPKTRARLQRVAEAMRRDRDVIEATLSPLRIDERSVPPAGPFSPTPTAGSLSLLECYENVFRDWSWGESESARALDLVRRLMSEGRAEGVGARLAVLGAGAGRLAADVHQHLGPARTLALDLNPLPLLIAERLVHGETIDAIEFPVAPRSENDVTVARRLQCPFSLRPGLMFLLADGVVPPFPAASLDIVITPWFIDAVDADPRATAATINRVLKPGGSWINFGPLRFSGTTSRIYMIDEVLEIVTASGFQLSSQIREQVPYFANPESGFQRMELVYGFAAHKVAETSPVALPRAEPEWVTDPRVPVPALEQWAAIRRSAMLAGAVASMADGESSIADMADALGQSWGVDPRPLDSQLQAFIHRLLPR